MYTHYADMRSSNDNQHQHHHPGSVVRPSADGIDVTVEPSPMAMSLTATKPSQRSSVAPSSFIPASPSSKMSEAQSMFAGSTVTAPKRDSMTTRKPSRTASSAQWSLTLAMDDRKGGKRAENAMQISIVLIPLLVVVGLSSLALYQAWASKAHNQSLHTTIDEAVAINGLINLIGHEEDAACSVLAMQNLGRSSLSAHERFRQAQSNTDSLLKHLDAEWNAHVYGPLDNFTAKLNDVRTAALQGNRCDEAISVYRSLSRPLILSIAQHFGDIKRARMCQYLTSYQTFIKAKDELSSVFSEGKSYFYGSNMSKLQWTDYHESHGAANALFDAAINTVQRVAQGFGQGIQGWQQAFAQQYPDVNAEWQRLEWIITEQAAFNASSQNSWEATTTALLAFLKESEEKIHEMANEALAEAVEFQQREMYALIGVIVLAAVVCPTISVLYAVFLRRQRLRIVHIARRVRLQASAIRSEEQKTVQLLNHMLPKHVVDGLRAGNVVVPESYQSVTILFAEITGFSALVHTTEPSQIVEILNTYYQGVDSVLELHKCYKVEIVNDCVVCSSGVPYRCGNRHSDEIATTALDILQTVSNTPLPHVAGEHLLVKMGIHTGPCTSGVLGSNKPKFCLFGDAVNTSSRMMSTSEPMRVHVSESTHAHLVANHPNQFEFHERGKRQVKGKGMMTTYWILAKRDHQYTINLADAEKVTENTTYFRRDGGGALNQLL